jgi:hypothetical protein
MPASGKLPLRYKVTRAEAVVKRNADDPARRSRDQRENNTAQIPLSQPEEETADER